MDRDRILENIRERNPVLYEEVERLRREGKSDYPPPREPEEGTMAYEYLRLARSGKDFDFQKGAYSEESPTVSYALANIKETLLLQLDFPEEGGGIQLDFFQDGSLVRHAWGREMFARQVELSNGKDWVRVFDPKRMFRD